MKNIIQISNLNDTYVNEELSVDLRTNQNTVVLPTAELLKSKGTDFRVLLGISIISNVDNNVKSGSNSRYCSIKKVDRHMKKICSYIDISVSQFRKHLRKLLECNSDEFRVVDRIYKHESVKCYEMKYKAGGFVLIPIEKSKVLISNADNNSIKLYANLLWLCVKNGEFIERELTQDYLLKLMGLSPNSRMIITKATSWLENANLIRTRKEWVSETILDSEGMPRGTSPRAKIYYSIVNI